MFWCFFTYCLSFCDVKHERCPQMSVTVRLQSACFGHTLLWHCCSEKKTKKEKYSYRTSVCFFLPFFLVHHSFVPVSRKSFLWTEPWRDSQKSPINILIQMTLRSLSPTSIVFICAGQKRIFGLVISGLSPAG